MFFANRHLAPLLCAASMAGVLALASCASHTVTGPVVSRLYFGLGTSSGTISQQEFQAFVDSCVTPLFPDGLTQYTTQGQWRNKSGVIQKEPSAVIEVIHPDNANNAAKLTAIIDKYKTAYKQESVLMVQDKAKISF